MRIVYWVLHLYLGPGKIGIYVTCILTNQIDEFKRVRL